MTSKPDVTKSVTAATMSDASICTGARFTGTAATGKIRWISQLRRWQKEKKKDKAIRWTGPVLAGNRLVLVSTHGDLVYADPSTGNVQADIEMDKRMSLPPVVANNTLYILADDGKLTALR